MEFDKWEVVFVEPRNNDPAYYCYKTTGFQDVALDEMEKYQVLGEEWDCLELEIQL